MLITRQNRPLRKVGKAEIARKKVESTFREKEESLPFVRHNLVAAAAPRGEKCVRKKGLLAERFIMAPSPTLSRFQGIVCEIMGIFFAGGRKKGRRN